MSVFRKIFGRKEKEIVRPIPPWEEIVEYMQGRQLSLFADDTVQVLVSRDRARRVIILQSKNGYYKTLYEEIRVFDEDEWAYFSKDPNRYPAWWEPADSSINTKSFYGSAEDALEAIRAMPEYRAHFE